jgi:ribosomal protein L40E
MGGIWSYLAFRHSLLLGREILLSDNDSSSIAHNRVTYSRQPDNLAVETLPLPSSDAARQTARKLPDMTDNTSADTGLNYSYCSSCGAESSSVNKFCRRCGANLQLLRKITRNSWLQTWLDSMLDWYVRARSNPEAIRVGSALFMFAVVYLLFIVSKIARKGIDWTLWFNAAFMFPFLVTGAWDYLHYRALRKDNAKTQQARLTATLASPEAVPDQVNAALTTDRLPPPYPRLPDEPPGVTENTTRQLIDRSVP